MLVFVKKKLKKPTWKPPKGFIAIQTYVLKDVHDVISKLARNHERTLRAELRTILTEYVRHYLNPQKPADK